MLYHQIYFDLLKLLLVLFVLTIVFAQVFGTCEVFAQITASNSADPLIASASAIPQDRPDSQAIIGQAGSGSGAAHDHWGWKHEGVHVVMHTHQETQCKCTKH